MKILFWLLVVIDTIGLGLMFLLGLGFAGPSQTYIMGVVRFFALPFCLLLAAVAVFLFGKSPAMRGAAFLLAVSPLLAVAYNFATAKSAQVEGAEKALEEAIRAGDVEAVRAALRTADVNKPGSDGVLPLTRVMDKGLGDAGELLIMRELLAAGARPNAGAESAVSPLERAIEITKWHGTEPMMLLLKAGAKPNARPLTGEPVFFAAAREGIDVSVMRTLVEHGADLRLLDEQGRNVLWLARLRENRAVEEYLIQQGLR